MDLKEFDIYCKDIFDLTLKDKSQNGIQVENDKEIEKVAFAVDASFETILRTKENKADILFVHHGLFWSKPFKIRYDLYKKIAVLIKNNIALYVLHLPLDSHDKLGNNATIAKNIALDNYCISSLFENIGLLGSYKNSIDIDEVFARAMQEDKALFYLKKQDKIKNVVIISGSGLFALDSIIKYNFNNDNKIDLLITGDCSHQHYLSAIDNNISILSMGHYNSEKTGILSFKKRFEIDNEIETIFIDNPSDL